MSESIFSTFEVKLYGRVVEDLGLKLPKTAKIGARKEGIRQPYFKEETTFDDSLLGQQVKGDNPDPSDQDNLPNLARIYGTSFEGHFYTLPKPTIFLVHG